MTSIIATFHPSSTSSSLSSSDTNTTSPSRSPSSSSPLLSTKTITISLLAGGISAGVILVAIVFALAACCVIKRKKRRRKAMRSSAKSESERRQQHHKAWIGMKTSDGHRNEMKADDEMAMAFEMHGAVAKEDRHGQAGGSGDARRSMELIPAVEPVVVRERADSSWPWREVELASAEKTLPASWL